MSKRLAMLISGGNFYARSSHVMAAFSMFTRRHEVRKPMRTGYDVLSIIATILIEVPK